MQVPVLYNQIAKRLSDDLSSISWLTGDIYGIAEIGSRPNGNKDDKAFKIVQVYKQDGSVKYLDISPKSILKAYSFFELETPDMEVAPDQDDITISLNLVVWANLQRVDATKNYDFTDYLVATVLKNLKSGYFSNEISKIKVIIDKNKIYDKYGYSFDNLNHLMFPFTAFKIQFEMIVPDLIDCIV